MWILNALEDLFSLGSLERQLREQVSLRGFVLGIQGFVTVHVPSTVPRERGLIHM